jgi:hypothetical protein
MSIWVWKWSYWWQAVSEGQWRERQGSQSGVGALEGQGNAAEDAEGALGEIGCNKRKPILDRLKIPLTGPAS